MRRRTRFIDGQDYHRAGVMNDIAAGADASGLLDVVGSHPKNRAAINRTRRNGVGFGSRIPAGLDRLDLEREDFAIRTI